MSELSSEAYDRKYRDSVLVRRVLQYLSRTRRKALLMVTIVFIMAVVQATLPLAIAQGIGVVSTPKTASYIPLLAGLIIAIGVGTWVLNWIRRQLTTTLLADVVADMRKDAFHAAVHQDLSFYDTIHVGGIVSRITGDTQQFGDSLLLGIDTINQLAFVLILMCVLLTIEWQLTLVVLAMGAAILFATQWFRRHSRHATQQSARMVSEVNKAVQETVTGIHIAKNFHQEATLRHEFRAVNNQNYTISLRREWIINGIFPVLQILTGASTAAIIFFGGYSAIAGIISISSWYLFIVTIDRFWIPFSDLSAFWSQFQMGLAALERIFALIDAEPTIVQTDSQPISSLHGDIELKQVSFHYSRQEQVLEHFDLHIQPGERVALVGHTGAGKSSILKLIERFYEFQAGQILIDGRDIRTLDLSAFRHLVGSVPQSPFLFTGTIADNIRYGNPYATEADILAIAQHIGGGDWLRVLPAGLQSDVGERGNRLSAGQRQLVTLIRMLLKKPGIFLLDEATANIDPFTEAQIQEALALLMKNRTSIVIAHRLSTIQAVDRIIVLQKGQIVEEGSHDTLLAQGGQYAELYNLYFRHQSLDYQPQRGQFGFVAQRSLP